MEKRLIDLEGWRAETHCPECGSRYLLDPQSLDPEKGTPIKICPRCDLDALH